MGNNRRVGVFTFTRVWQVLSMMVYHNLCSEVLLRDGAFKYGYLCVNSHSFYVQTYYV